MIYIGYVVLPPRCGDRPELHTLHTMAGGQLPVVRRRSPVAARRSDLHTLHTVGAPPTGHYERAELRTLHTGGAPPTGH